MRGGFQEARSEFGGKCHVHIDSVALQPEILQKLARGIDTHRQPEMRVDLPFSFGIEPARQLDRFQSEIFTALQI